MSNKHKGRTGGIVGFAITAAVLGSIFSSSGIIGIAVIGAISFGVGKVVGIMSSGLDVTTHNRQDKPQREIQELASQKTGDENVDAVIAKGAEMLQQIRDVNKAIPDQRLTEQMFRLEEYCMQIFKTVAEQPEKAGQIRKFMNYYLPTTLKMLTSYRTMQERGVSRNEMLEARNSLTRGMDMVLTACQKQVDNLFQSDLLDISTDIDVLEKMLHRDGFVDGGLGNIPLEAPKPVEQPRTYTAQPEAQPVPEAQHSAPVIQQPRTAASAQLGTDARPTLFVDADGDGVDDFKSFYQQKK